MKNHFLKLTAILSFFVLTGCVAPLEPPKSNTDYKNIIGKPFKLGNIEVAQYDFPEVMDWDDAKKACEALGQGWRLPDQDELELLFQKKDKIGGFAGNFYWSSYEFGRNGAWYQSFGLGSQRNDDKVEKHYVRAVRAF